MRPRCSPSWTWKIPGAGDPGSPGDSRADRALTEAIEAGFGEWSGLEDEESPPRASRSRVQKLIDEGAATCDGRKLRSNAPLPAGSEVRIDFPEPLPLELVPEDRPLDILWQDEHLVVVNKPQGLTVHPSETQATGTLVHALLHHVKDLSGIGGVARPGIVHRIDKDTSGVLVITKTDAAHLKLSELFSRHELERRYWALCYGSLAGASGMEKRVETLIGRNPNDRKKMSAQVAEGRRAVTWIRQLEAYGVPSAKPFASLVEARLETGRTHQVRVHLTEEGHSLLGDPLYGVPSDRAPKWLALPPAVRERVRGLPGQALHARLLAFDHPITGQRLRFEAEPPEAFRLLLETLRGYR
jgi:23S rRNA pseudouridine1911/1915/1917 synthase